MTSCNTHNVCFIYTMPAMATSSASLSSSFYPDKGPSPSGDQPNGPSVVGLSPPPYPHTTCLYWIFAPARDQDPSLIPTEFANTEQKDPRPRRTTRRPLSLDSSLTVSLPLLRDSACKPHCHWKDMSHVLVLPSSLAATPTSTVSHAYRTLLAYSSRSGQPFH